MKNSIIIKSYQNGITIYLDQDMPFQTLLDEIQIKFQQTGKFFKDAKMALSLEGRMLSPQEEKQIVDTIMLYSNLNIVCLVGKEEGSNRNYLKALDKLENRSKAKEGQLYRGTLTEGQTLESETSLIIVGDVCLGACVNAIKDIIVIGGLYGKAYAGEDGKNNHFIFALDINAEVLQIGDFIYQPPKSTLFTKKSKADAYLACIEDSKIVVEPVSKEKIKTFYI